MSEDSQKPPSPKREEDTQSPNSNLSVPGTPLPPGQDLEREFRTLKRMIFVAQICAVVSLVIGGVLLSTAAIVLALVARSKANNLWIAATRSQDQRGAVWYALRRTATITAIMAMVALILNAISLIYFYPMAAEILQGGDGGSVWGGSSGALDNGSGNSGSSAWG